MHLGRKIVQRFRQGYVKVSTPRIPQPSPMTEIREGTPVTQVMSMPRQLEVASSKPLQMEMAEKEAEDKFLSTAIEIPPFSKKIKVGKLQLEEEKPLPPIIYPLIPSSPKKGDPIYAYAKIFWDNKTNTYIYQVIEPDLPPRLSGVMVKIKELLEEKLDIDFSKLKVMEASDYLSKQIADLMNYFKFKITPNESSILRYYIERDFIGLGKLEPLMKDKNIEDISCDGIGIPIFVFHRNPKLGSIPTSVAFDDSDELDSFISRLSQLSGKSISVVQPLVDGSLPDGSRLQATLATDIARRGSNFTIRRFSEEPLTPIHLLNSGTVDAKMLAYLWLAVEFGRSMLISGGTASGKTTLLNVISLFMRHDKKIISIEDTAELRLPHPHWVPTVARTAISVEEGKGEVDMFSLLKESLRQRPDYIIVGEVRGKEAYILFQQMATGHPSLGTIHAENVKKLVDRLTTQPISLPKPLISSVDLVVFQMRTRYKNKHVRRISEIVEMIKFDAQADEPVVNQMFKWNPFTDTFDIASKSMLLKKISDLTGLKPEELIDELQRRALVLEWMQQKNILDYQSVHKIITMYNTNPRQLLTAITGER